MDYHSVAELACSLQRIEVSSIHFDTSVEVVFDCMNCKRCNRTVRFAGVGSRGICTPADQCDGFLGKLFSVKPFDDGERSFVIYQIQYQYYPFLDLKSGIESAFEPKWGRVSFQVTCSKCGARTFQSTQNNLVRPFAVLCQCGAHLYDESGEIPLLRAHTGDPM